MNENLESRCMNLRDELLQHKSPFKGAEEVFNQYYDTAGNYHFTGVRSGEHIIRRHHILIKEK